MIFVLICYTIQIVFIIYFISFILYIITGSRLDISVFMKVNFSNFRMMCKNVSWCEEAEEREGAFTYFISISYFSVFALVIHGSIGIGLHGSGSY